MNLVNSEVSRKPRTVHTVIRMKGDSAPVFAGLMKPIYRNSSGSRNATADRLR